MPYDNFLSEYRSLIHNLFFNTWWLKQITISDIYSQDHTGNHAYVPVY